MSGESPLARVPTISLFVVVVVLPSSSSSRAAGFRFGSSNLSPPLLAAVGAGAAAAGIEILGLEMMVSTNVCGGLIMGVDLSGAPSMKVDLRLKSSSSRAPKSDSRGEKMDGTRLGPIPDDGKDGAPCRRLGLMPADDAGSGRCSSDSRPRSRSRLSVVEPLEPDSDSSRLLYGRPGRPPE